MIIGIDPGTHTGFAIWNPVKKKFKSIGSIQIHEVIMRISAMHDDGLIDYVVFEDARQRKWFGNQSKAEGIGKLQGVGSVKRDCSIIEDFLIDLDIPHLAIKPSAGTTKWTAARFKRVTGWEGRTNEHGRDAAILVFGRTMHK